MLFPGLLNNIELMELNYYWCGRILLHLTKHILMAHCIPP